MSYFNNEPYTAYKLLKEFKALRETYQHKNGGDENTFAMIVKEYYDKKEQINRAREKSLYAKWRNDMMKEQKPKEEEPPAKGLRLEPVIGGVAIIGTREVTTANRDQISLHGGKWNFYEKQWRAYEKPAIKKLCKWFGISYECMQDQIDEKTRPTLGTLARMIENGEPLDEIKRVTIGRFNNIESFLKVFNESYRPALERLSEGIIQHNDMMVLRHFADDMLMAFGFDIPDEDGAK